MQAAVRYLISLLARDEAAAGQVGYTANPAEYARYRLVIKPSGWLSTVAHPDTAPRPVPFLFDGVPALFGAPVSRREGTTLVVEADWVASAYYLVTRYEEWQCPRRDRHGRMSGRDSLLCRLGWLDRPLIDAYSRQLRGLLGRQGVTVSPVPPGRVVLTHDIDSARRFRGLRPALGAVRRRQWALLWRALHGADPYADFEGVARLDGGLPAAPSFFFAHVAGPTGCPEDACCRPLSASDWEAARRLRWGVHFSALSAREPDRLPAERARLARQCGAEPATCRFHYLMTPAPAGWRRLEECGITDDYTLGFADLPGFRLGTSRPVRYIDPLSGRVSERLTLHPLLLMDVTLSDYMRLPPGEALAVSLRLCREALGEGGEAVLLWHNSSLAEGADGYHRSLYARLLDALAQESVGDPADAR